MAYNGKFVCTLHWNYMCTVTIEQNAVQPFFSNSLALAESAISCPRAYNVDETDGKETGNTKQL